MRTGSVNRVWLMGWVARPPVVEDGACRLVVATRDGERTERTAVVANASVASRAADLATGDAVYLEGRLEQDGGGARVAAQDLWRVDAAADGGTADRSSIGTHASPRPHERRGHWRRVAKGTQAERLVWVNECSVGGHSPLTLR